MKHANPLSVHNCGYYNEYYPDSWALRSHLFLDMSISKNQIDNIAFNTFLAAVDTRNFPPPTGIFQVGNSSRGIGFRPVAAGPRNLSCVVRSTAVIKLRARFCIRPGVCIRHRYRFVSFGNRQQGLYAFANLYRRKSP